MLALAGVSLCRAESTPKANAVELLVLSQTPVGIASWNEHNASAFRDGDTWMAVHCGEITCAVRDQQLIVTACKVPTTEGEQDGHWLSTSGAPRFLFRSEAMNYRGEIPVARRQVFQSASSGLEAVRISADWHNVAYEVDFEPIGSNPESEYARSLKLYILNAAGQRVSEQLLETLYSEIFEIDLDVQRRVIWAGDLNGDGKLDLVIDLASLPGTEVNARLYLSGADNAESVLSKAAEYYYWPDDMHGC